MTPEQLEAKVKQLESRFAQHKHSWVWYWWPRINASDLKWSVVWDWLWIQVKTWFISISSTWTLAVTWIWFAPKLVSFKSASGKSTTETDVSKSTSEPNPWIRTWQYADKVNTNTTQRAFELYEQWSDTYSNADCDSLDNDWFTLDVTTLDFNVTLYYTCIG